jgi:F-type H+-transporting ATPase subunit gamma
MAGTKEIRVKIKSVQNTRKITRAMEMVAASKMRRAQERMRAARPYADKVRNVVAHLAHAATEYRHPFLMPREVKRVGLIVVSSDRGLCGGLNANLFRAVASRMKEFKAEGLDASFCVIGGKAAGFIRRTGGEVLAEATHLGDRPGAEALIGPVKVMLDAFLAGRIDRLYLVYNRFISSMAQKPVIEQLLPVEAQEKDKDMAHHWDYLYEPDSREILDAFLMRYVESLVYQGVVENIACEQAARMVAMKSASDNASNIIGELQLIYNKVRQAAITQEIAEIVGGAAAV